MNPNKQQKQRALVSAPSPAGSERGLGWLILLAGVAALVAVVVTMLVVAFV